MYQPGRKISSYQNNKTMKRFPLLFFILPLLASQTSAQNSSYSANTVPVGGTYSTAFGVSALHVNTGTGNTATGYTSLYNNSSGGSNTATGRASMYVNTTGNYNSAHGYYALFGNTTGSYNCAAGAYALLFNSVGSCNSAFGYQALYLNSGSFNTATGYQALYNNTSGISNTSVGNEALRLNTTGNDNTAVGYRAMYSNVSSSSNTACGKYSLYYNTTGDNNVALGYFALFNNTTGGYNTATGINALANNISGTNNTAFGNGADLSADGFSNATAIGNTAIADANNKVRIGNTSVTSIGGQVGWTIYSDARVKNNLKEDVPGLSFISLLKPVTYNYNVAKENELLGIKHDTLSWPGKKDIEKMKFSGFVAQEVDMAAQKIGYDFSGVDKTGNVMGLRYADFVVPLVKAIQEQQQQIDELKKMIAGSGTVANSNMELSDGKGLALRQNAPNPFTKQTTIGFSIPQNAGSAQMLFYDATGHLISTHIIADRGKGLLTVNANDLSSGAYNYSLVVDGKLVETRQLIKQ